MYHAGKADGQAAAELNYVALQATILNMTASFITRTEVNSQFSTLTSALSAEVSARQAADSTLTSNLNTLTTNLASNVATLTANLNTEITSGASLSASVGTLTTSLVTTIANLNNEITSRLVLNSAIATETSRALAAENILTTNFATITANLNNEISARVTLGAILTTNVATVTTNLNTLSLNLTNQVTVLATTIAILNATIVNGSSTSCGTASSTASSVIGTPEYWMDSSVATNETISTTIVTANLNGYVLKVLGVGFSTYYNPQFQVSFLCMFYHPAIGNVTSFGVVLYDPVASFLFYHVECPVPVIAMALPVTIFLYKSNGQLYPFGGFYGANILTVQYYWTSVVTTPANTLAVTGLGFNVLRTLLYKCVFTGRNSTNGVVTKSYFNTASNLTRLDCGLTPAGFAVVSGTSTVNLTIFEGNGDNSTGYQVQPLGSAAITYSTCMDGAKDGDETDGRCAIVITR